MIRIGRVYSMKPKFEFSIGQNLMFNGLVVELVIWRSGVVLTFTTKKIYQQYRSAWQTKVMNIKGKVEKELKELEIFRQMFAKLIARPRYIWYGEDKYVEGKNEERRETYLELMEVKKQVDKVRFE